MACPTSARMECVVPFPACGIPCPICKKTQRDSSTFKTHARRVHHVNNPETPTTCSICSQVFNTFRAGSAHYSRKHLVGPSTPDAPSGPLMQTPPPAKTPEVVDVIESVLCAPKSLNSSRLPQTEQTPSSTRKLIQHVLQNAVPPKPPRQPSPTTSAECTPPASTTSHRPLSPEFPPPIPINSRSTICPHPEREIRQLVRHYRRQPTSRPHRQPPPPPTSPPPNIVHHPSDTLQELNNNLDRLRATLEDIDPNDDDSQSTPPRPNNLPIPDSLSDSPIPSTNHPMSPNNPSPTLFTPSQPSPPHEPSPRAAPATNTNIHPSHTPDHLVTSQSDLERPNCEELQNFHDHWSITFSAHLPWEEFSEQCELFADSCRALASTMNAQNRPQRNNPPAPNQTPDAHHKADALPTLTQPKPGKFKASTAIPRNVRPEDPCLQHHLLLWLTRKCPILLPRSVLHQGLRR
ncbi:extensin-like [Dendronephthya gigantea]|uniref:extensin-like n=1 Tax=Dendronephthya gigantea TaxID=151771 RepID=UPI00106D2E3D|nr:extensin-like [Dendronephthya gigantea]